MRRCECGCGADLDTLQKRPHARFASGACRAKASKRARSPQGSAQKAHRTPKRRSPRPGVTVYFRDPAHLTALRSALDSAWTGMESHDADLDAATEAVDAALARHRAKQS